MENGATQGEDMDPSKFLSEIIGNAVTVKLNSGLVYKGASSRLSSTVLAPVPEPCPVFGSR